MQQSGVPQFAVGDIVTDFNILEVARQEASALWKVKSGGNILLIKLSQSSETQDEAANFSIRRGNFEARK